MSYNKRLLVFSLAALLVLASMFFFIGRVIDFIFDLNIGSFLPLLSLVIVSTIILDKIYINKTMASIYFFVMQLLGASFIFFAFMILFSIVYYFFPAQIVGYLFFILAIITITYSFINANVLRHTKIKLNFKLKKPIKLVHVSDIHLGTILAKQFLNQLVKKINKIKPDATLITGDLFDGSGKVTLKDLEPLKRLKSKVFFTTGNHENYSGLEEKLKMLKQKKVQILRNKIINFKGLQIIGLDNPENELTEEIKPLNKLNEKIKKPAIIMLHTPTAIGQFVKTKAKLLLSGHTHKGQIFPFTLLVRLFYKYIYGLYKLKEDKFLYVSSGAGTWGPRMRLGSKSEIVSITIK
ncbi:MAG: metallophosphoesterase [Candidatus Woesearchaeota archaeon]